MKQLYEKYMRNFDDSQRAMACSLESITYCVKLINTFGLTNILDLGSGVSTLLFLSQYDNIRSMDTDPKWANKTEAIIRDLLNIQFNVNTNLRDIKDNQYDFIFYDLGNLEDRIYNFPQILSLGAKYIYLDDFHILPYRYYVESKINGYRLVYLPETIDSFGRFGALLIKNN
ncbi:hypothetical protein [Sphingobacterium anhuiense]|uniref:Uncharacterized protein n=1 Tax=Sphingobacterium anhuiense TaxID=493780 RepID=A0ABW5YQ41_9SPHI